MNRHLMITWILILCIMSACGPSPTPTAPPAALDTPVAPMPTAIPPIPTSSAPYLAPWYVQGVMVETYAGTGVPGHRDGPAAEAQFNTPVGLTVDAAGNLYVFDWFNFLIRLISPDGMVSTLAGTGEPGQQPQHADHHHGEHCG